MDIAEIQVEIKGNKKIIRKAFKWKKVNKV